MQMTLKDLPLVFDLVFETMMSLGGLVDSGIRTQHGSKHFDLHVFRMKVSRLGQIFKEINRHYNTDTVKHFMSINALARMEVVHETLSRMVHQAMDKYFRSPFRCTERFTVTMTAVFDRGEETESIKYQVSWKDELYHDVECRLVLVHRWADVRMDEDKQKFLYVNPEDGTFIIPDADQNTRKDLSDEDKQAVVQAHLYYFMCKFGDDMVRDFFVARRQFEDAKREREDERRQDRYLEENRDVLYNLYGHKTTSSLK